jgi:branched-chain amino acid transport system ATP-binding protein
LQLEQGQILGLLGRNGVGKTTLVNSIVGFNPPRRGKILFKGADITRNSSFATIRSGMGLVPQGRRVFPTLSVEENLLVAQRSIDRHGWSLDRVYALFPRLLERRNQRAKTLSGGEQQMLAIARGLMTNPDCLLMDEPSEGLAPIIIQGVWEAIGKLKEEGLSILLVEQNASLALKLVDYVHVMSKGQVVYSARPEELRANDEIKSTYLGI